MDAIHQLQAQSEAGTLHGFAKATGLESLANAIEGDTFVVCDLTRHGIEGCAAMRATIAQQHMIAELAALGILLLVIAVSGAIAVAFVDEVSRALKRRREDQGAQATITVISNDNVPPWTEPA